jgi:hypothetical protein
VIPVVVELETTRGGLMAIVRFVAVRVVGIVTGLGGLVEVLIAVSAGLVNDICNWL